jgi:hypothetical protein
MSGDGEKPDGQFLPGMLRLGRSAHLRAIAVTGASRVSGLKPKDRQQRHDTHRDERRSESR